MDDLEFFSKPALMERAKEMGLKGCYKFKKKQLIELIKNPPPKMDDDLDSFSKPVKYTGVKKKVTLQPVDPEGEELVFPSINAAAKHFNMNSGSFGWKVASKKEETKNTIVIDGIKYKLRFESYTLKKKCKD